MIINRNLKSLDNKTGNRIKMKIDVMLNNHDHWCKSCFWTPYKNTDQGFNEYLEFRINGVRIKWEQNLSLSNKIFYWNNDIIADGSRKDIGFIKKIINTSTLNVIKTKLGKVKI